nr:integrase, catalytic region, zinc finger, CCHC-type, peptidase aspartic, catalytic [Tanacetum cinerariifolium]
MYPPDRNKFCWGIPHATGHKGFTDLKTGIWLNRIYRKIRIPIDPYPCQVEEKLTMKEVDGETIMKLEMKMNSKDDTVSKFPGKFPAYTPSKEEEEPEKKGRKEAPGKGPNYEFLSYPVSDNDSDLEDSLDFFVQDKMSRDVITVGSTMRIPLLYRGKSSQWRERFMNYLEEQTDGEAMINFIQNVINDLKKCGYKKDNCELNYKFLNNLQPEWKQYSTLMRQTKNLMDINIDALYNILKQNQGDVNDALGYKKKAVVVTSDPLALVAEKIKVSKHKEKVEVQSESEGSNDEDISDLKKITALLAKAFNRKKYYAKPTNYNFRTSSASSSANKKPEYVKSVENKEDKKADEKKRDMSKVKCYNCKKESKNFIENHIDSQKDYDKSEVDHNDSEEKEHLVDKLIRKFNHKIAKCQKHIEKANQQSKDLENQNKDLQDKYDVLINQEQNNKFNEQMKVLNEKNTDLLAQTEVLQDQLKVKHVVIDTHTEFQAQYAKLEEERYEYMIRYSALCDNDKQHRKNIDEQEILFDKMSRQRMIPEPGEENREVTVIETFHVETDDELSKKELKQIKADDQAIQTILLGLPEDIYAAVDSCETAKEICTHGNSNNPYAFPAPHQDQPSFNQNYMQQPIPNPEDITVPITAMNMALALMAKAFKLNYSTPTNNNQRISSNPRNRQIAQPGMNMGQDRQMQMVGGNGENQFRQYAGQNAWNMTGYNDVIGNQIGNGNLVAARAEGNAAGQNGNQIRCYNCRGVGHYARNCTVRSRRRDASYLHTQLLITQEEEAGIQLQAEQYDLMAVAADIDEIKEVNANCILMANLQQASTSGTQTDSALVYDSDRSAEVHKNCNDNEIFNMFTQKEQYTELLEPIPESHQVPQNDNDVISEDTSVEQGGETVEQHPANFEEIRALYESLYQNLAIEVEKVNSVNRKLKATNADLTTELSRFKNQTRMTIETHNWSSFGHQELHKIVREEIFPIVKQVDARVQNFKIQFLREAVKFVGDFKSLSNEADASLAKHKALELEIKRLLKAVVKRFENRIIKKENENAKLWNDWYKKCDECKYDIISYDKAYKDMQQKIKRLQAQLGDLKGKSKDTSCVSDTRNPLSQKLENENVELEFQKVSDQKDNTCDTSKNTKFAKKPIVENLPKVGESHTLSKPVTSNSVSTPQESKVVNNDKVIAPGMFRINPLNTSREAKNEPTFVRASDKKKPITVSQPPIITKKDVNSDVNGLSSTGVDNTKTRRPQPKSNTKNDRVPSASKSSQSKNKEAEVEEHHRNLLLSKNNKHMSSACHNIKPESQDVISKVVYTMCKQCLISVNHDVCLCNYVNGKNSRAKKQKEKVYVKEIQKKYQPKLTKPKKVGLPERLATPKPRKPRFLLRLSPTNKLFDQEGKLVASSESESQYDCSNGDNACTSNTLESKIKWFPNSISLLDRVYFVEGLGHNLFSIGQFCDSDLEVAFRRNACFVRNLEGVDLLKGDRSTNLYTINLHEMAYASPIYLMARASST